MTEHTEGADRSAERETESAADGGTQSRVGGREQRLEHLHQIAADRERSREEKIEALIRTGVERLGVSHGFLTRIEDGTQTIEISVGDHPGLQPGSTAPLSESYCRHTLAADDTFAVADAPADGWEDDPGYERFGLGCYLGVPIYVDDEQYGTVCFADADPRDTFDPGEETFVELVADWIHYMVEQRAYEQELEQQQAFTESLMNSLPDPLYAVGRDGTVLRWNDRMEEVTGYTPEEIEEMDALSLLREADRDAVAAMMDAVWKGERRSVEAHLQTADDDVTVPYEFSGGPLRDETGTITGVAGVGRDISERTAHRERLSNLLETTRSLMQARDREHVAELATNAARELLGFDSSVFHLYDSDAETLVPAATTEGAVADLPIYDVGEGAPGEVFASGELLVQTGADAEQTGLGEMAAAMHYPVGVHGTISVGSAEGNSFDETDRQVLALLATSAAAACMRAKRETEVREAREHTERVLDRVNGLVQNIVEELVQATTREELERGVVDELAATDPYAFAWIGQPDVASETLSPTAWAGDANLSIQGRTFELNRGGEPVSDAYREGTTQSIDTLADEEFGPWAEIADHSEVASLLVVPLSYKDTTYGVLAVFAEHDEVLDERERVVIGAIGRAVANAINAIERGRILDATEIIELEFAIDDPDLLFCRLAAGADCRIESAGVDYRSDGNVRLYLSATDVDPEELLELARQDGEILEVTCIVAHEDECLLEVVVAESLFATLSEYGAVPREAVAEGATTTITVELPYETEARELFELVEDRYPGTELLGYHEREREVQTSQDFKASLSDRLTDRQETALRTAYLGGFFDWPREVDGNELAEAMDIARPTYHQHLRVAQRKVFEELFE